MKSAKISLGKTVEFNENSIAETYFFKKNEKFVLVFGEKH